MKGDFTRFSHQPKKHYAAVLMQQGRVQLDADWNEQLEIDDHRWRIQTIDTIGGCGVPIHAAGFEIGLSLDGADLTISPGRIYVDGVLGELEQTGVTYTNQPDYPGPRPPLNPVDGRIDLVYLDVWRYHVTAIQDPELREVALGGPDTTTRLQTVCQVKLLPDVGDINCSDDLNNWNDLVAPSLARMSSQAVAVVDPNDPCLIAPGAGYRGLENRLYRVEIHNPGALGTATFKWSRDNGSLLTSIDSFIGGADHRIQLASLGRDQVLRFKIGDWVEVLSDETELGGVPGAMAQITDIPDEAQRIISLGVDVSAFAAQTRSRVRRWDQPSDVITTAGPWMDLEDGVQIGFSGGPFRTGDYWVIPARTATGDVEGFTDAPPRGIHHHYCRLALVTWHVDATGNVTADIRDCRKPFPPLTELPTGGACCCTVTVGDGVTSKGDFSDIQSAVNALQNGGRVCIQSGVYTLRDTVMVRGNDLIISGCDRQSSIIGPQGQPAFRVEGQRVSLKSLYVEAQSPEGAIVVGKSHFVDVIDCIVGNRGVVGRSPLTHVSEAARGALGPALMVLSSRLLYVRDNLFLGLPAISLQAEMAEVTDNLLSGGGIWVRDGSSEIKIENNEIAQGRGAGVALGGLGRDEEPSLEAAGVEKVEIIGNHIYQMGNSGIATVFERGAGQKALADVQDVTIAHNRIVACAQEGPDAFFAHEAVGGIVLRDVGGVRVLDNYIAENGTAKKIRACGVFVFMCQGLEMADNTIVGNGSVEFEGRQTQCIDFKAAPVGEAPNPRNEQGASILVRNAAGAPAGQTRVVTSGAFTGLDCGFRTEITLSTPSPSVAVTLVHFALSATVTAFNADGSVAGTKTMSGPQNQAETLTFTGTAINRIVIQPRRDETLLLDLCFETAEQANYQAGVVALYVIGGDIQQVGGGGISPARFRYQAGAPAAMIHDNVIVCPRGHALIALGLGAMSVSDNMLTSQGMLNQPLALAQVGNCVFIYNLGRTPLLSNAMVGFRAAAFTHAEHAGGLADFDVAAAAAPLFWPDGRVLFHGNQVTLQAVDTSSERLVYSSVAIASLDDVSLQDNQFQVELPASSMLADVLAAGATVRGADNRFTELPGRAFLSYFSQGQLNIASDNQAMHCILAAGTQVIENDNQVIIATNCERLRELFLAKKG